ncbi:hypothetical protein PUN28_015075 [Cardiocondyla obscurior]|uniref:Uncharacterized protein n=1 Tax=Cardiocondyla obscurior TaxID=286306 RepID=A0AAW2EZ68_9HYME
MQRRTQPASVPLRLYFLGPAARQHRRRLFYDLSPALFPASSSRSRRDLAAFPPADANSAPCFARSLDLITIYAAYGSLIFRPRMRVAKLHDKQSKAISRNKNNCFRIFGFKKKANAGPIRK